MTTIAQDQSNAANRVNADLLSMLARIALQHLGVETLEVQHSDRLDFHDLPVWMIEDALRAAFEAGKAASKG